MTHQGRWYYLYFTVECTSKYLWLLCKKRMPTLRPIDPWRRGHYIVSKCWATNNQWWSATSQKNGVLSCFPHLHHKIWRSKVYGRNNTHIKKLMLTDVMVKRLKPHPKSLISTGCYFCSSLCCLLGVSKKKRCHTFI